LTPFFGLTFSPADFPGFQAFFDSFSSFCKAFPLLITAAGTLPAALFLVIGAGVAVLLALATAPGVGAIVFAPGVRMASCAPVASFGGRFFTVEVSVDLATSGGYALGGSGVFLLVPALLFSGTLFAVDIVICSALIPGSGPPFIISASMLENMDSGSFFYDFPAFQGGNVAFTQVDKIVEKNGVKILGERNILNKLPTSSSILYAKNVFNFVLNLYDKENKKININLQDEIIAKTIIK
jgi:NAD/NADP transhydrogenase alpha subunit